MKHISKTSVLLASLALFSVTASAREDVQSRKKALHKASYKDEAGDCSTPQAQFDLDINNVRARLLTGGDAWWNLSEARYEVPKGDGTGASLNALFAGAIWISGLDAGNNLKVAAQRYRAGGDDYWPGPLTNGLIDKATCNKYDRFFNVYGTEIDAALDAFAEKGVTGISVTDIPKSVLAWPAKGNQYLQTDPTLIGQTFTITDNLAPFWDEDQNGDYDPLKGDHPIIPCRGELSKAYADQMIFSVINDVGNLHTESNGTAIGVQINQLAFAFQTTDDINNMTFYKYEIINKSPNPLYQTYISQWADPDLGCFDNDRVGCDVSRSLGIIYNDGNDADCNGVAGYGSQLPLLGIDFFEGPLDDSARQLGLSSFVYFINVGTGDPKSDPSSAKQYRNLQEGFWKDGTPFTEDGNAYNSGGPVTKFVFPGDPCDPNVWSDQTSGQGAGDRRFVQTSGPFTLKSGDPQYVTVGAVFVQPPGGVGSPPCFSSISSADDKAQLLFDGCFKLLDGPDAPTLQIRELSNELIINLVNTSGNNIGESYDEPFATAVQFVKDSLGGIGDSTYTFEGYVLYQVANPRVSATDLPDPEHADATKAIPYARVDVKNGIATIVNFEADAALNLLIPTLKVSGEDKGITTSFRITQDLFATGDDKSLVNHKTYYYTAVAYAYNNYKPYLQSQPNGKHQLEPYLQGRGNFRIYSAIPHIPDPRNEGTVLNSEWGDGVEVKRIEGQGNGANNLRLDEATIEKIIASGAYAFSDTLTYIKKFDPIGFKITDPVSLKEADFELKFVDSTSGNYVVNDSSYWFLHDVTNNDTIWADRILDRPYEQQISLNKNGERTNYGFSIKLGTPAKIYTIPAGYPFAGLPERYVYGPLESSIEYQNPTEQWLSFLQDEGVNSTSNWIRSGIVANDPNSQAARTKAAADVFDANWYYQLNTPSPNYPEFTFTDSLEYFNKILNGTWAPYCLTANYAKKGLTSDDIDNGKPPFIYGPGFKWRTYGTHEPPLNNLDKLASVDIVITPDKTKWTRCVVFETGEDEGINEGVSFAPNGKAARKGQIRMHHSWHLDGWYMDGNGSHGIDTGRSWFPGYAINVETGERLNIAFGESSDQGDQNGRDMLWNPTSDVYSPITFPFALVDRLPYFGGKHFIYVMDTKYDEGAEAQRLLLDNYDKIGNPNTSFSIPQALRPLHYSFMWASMPYLTRNFSFAEDVGFKNVPPAEIKIKLRVEKPYNSLPTVSSNGIESLPRYQFSTKGLGATEKNKDVAVSACDMMRAVPNPYLAYSAYETDQNSSKIKITNLPNKCEITIFSLDGTLIRKLSRAIDVDPATNKKIDISNGAPISEVNLDNSIEWDLKNDKGIPIAGGVYLIHIEAPGICEKTIKWFGAVRPADTSNF